MSFGKSRREIATILTKTEFFFQAAFLMVAIYNLSQHHCLFRI